MNSLPSSDMYLSSMSSYIRLFLNFSSFLYRKQARFLKIHYGTVQYAKGIPNLVDKLAIHPEYEAENNQHDIAILKLKDIVRTVNVSKYIMNYSKSMKKIDEKAFVQLKH